LDHQVKIRGFRVELGEIEARLGELAAVRQAVVVLREERAGDPRIVAYVRPAEAAEVSGRALNQELKSRLPSYMLPSQYVTLAEFPLTPNGKIDRKALPAPDADVEASAESTHVPARNPTEHTLLEIWKKALGRPNVGVEDNFFDLGGHSLLAVKIFDEIHRELSVDLPLAALFEMPTVESLARRIDQAPSPKEVAPEWTTVVPMQPKGFRPPLFCVSGIGGNPMNFTSLVAALGEDQPFYGLQHRGADGKLAPHRAVRAMAEEFVSDIRKVQPRGPYYLAGYSAGGLAAYEMGHVLRELGEEIGLIILFDTFNPTLPPWSARERLQAHLDNLRTRGWSYIPNRIADRLTRRLRETQRRARARLAEHVVYKYRLDALVEAGLAAERDYKPQPYQGDLVVLQADARLSAGDGIGYKPHESNGWRGLVRGRLEVVEIASSHLDVMGDTAAPFAAAEVRRVLAQAQARRESVVRSGVVGAATASQAVP
jgi:thioesterase domain-containing protein/acyl carrier protein